MGIDRERLVGMLSCMFRILGLDYLGNRVDGVTVRLGSFDRLRVNLVL